jgi:hypothetical protein
VHQLWFALFEARGGYVSLQRPNLAFLLQQPPAEGEQGEAALRHAYYAWEDWIYGGQVPQGHLQRARRLWQLYHGLSSSALATFLAVPQTLFLRSLWPAGEVALLALALGLALTVRARDLA